MSDVENARENAALMERLLTAPQSGSVMQWFIMVALEEYCDRVITAGPDALANPMVDPSTWVACAKEVKEAVDDWQV